MGQVYRAVDPRLERPVAIKTLSSLVAADPELVRRFEIEAKAAGALATGHARGIVHRDLKRAPVAPLLQFRQYWGVVTKKWYSYFVVTDESTEVASPAAAAGLPPAEPPRVTDVVPDGGGEAAFQAPVEEIVDLDEVYGAARIVAPAHGYTVLKIAEMLQSEHIRSLPADVKRKSILVALDAAGVKVTDIVEDAVKRDRALDTYERVLEKHLEERRAAVADENARLEEEIAHRVAEVRAKIDENTRMLGAERQAFDAWQQQKRQEEATIADAVGYFVSENPITTTRVSADKGEVDVR